jgi:hypothetical protein
MNDRFVGDIGDFGKYGLLRWFCLPHANQTSPLSLSINWYYTKAVSDRPIRAMFQYLQSHSYKSLDPALFTALKSLRFSGGKFNENVTLTDLRQCTIFPPNTRHYDREVPEIMRNLARSHIERCKYDTARCKWHVDGISELGGSSVVFLDPDDGTPRSCRYAERHLKVLRSELFDYAAKFSVVICYQSFNYRNSLEQLRKYVQRLKDDFDDSPSIHLSALSFRSSFDASKPTRIYYIVYKDKHISEELQRLNDSGWSRLFALLA